MSAAAPLIWSRGYADLARRDNPSMPQSYFDAPTEAYATLDEMREMLAAARGFVWIRLGSRRRRPNDLSTFVRAVLPALNAPVELVSTDGDSLVPSDLEPGVADALLVHPCITRWHTQNYDGTVRHPRLRPLPIGLDLHTGSEATDRRRLLGEVLAGAAPWQARRDRVLLDVSRRTHPERDALERLLRGCPHVDVHTDRVPFRAAMELYASYRFAVSPRGGGLDCHRTWELLFLGTLPVVRSSPLDELYRGLPVVLVSDWRQVLDRSFLAARALALVPFIGVPDERWLRRDRWLGP